MLFYEMFIVWSYVDRITGERINKGFRHGFVGTDRPSDEEIISAFGLKSDLIHMDHPKGEPLIHQVVLRTVTSEDISQMFTEAAE